MKCHANVLEPPPRSWGFVSPRKGGTKGFLLGIVFDSSTDAPKSFIMVQTTLESNFGSFSKSNLATAFGVLATIRFTFLKFLASAMPKFLATPTVPATTTFSATLRFWVLSILLYFLLLLFLLHSPRHFPSFFQRVISLLSFRGVAWGCFNYGGIVKSGHLRPLEWLRVAACGYGPPWGSVGERAPLEMQGKHAILIKKNLRNMLFCLTSLFRLKSFPSFDFSLSFEVLSSV